MKSEGLKALLNSPSMLAVGIDPTKGEVTLMMRNGDGPIINKQVPLTPQIRLAIESIRSLLSFFLIALVLPLSGCATQAEVQRMYRNGYTLGVRHGRQSLAAEHTALGDQCADLRNALKKETALKNQCAVVKTKNSKKGVHK